MRAPIVLATLAAVVVGACDIRVPVTDDPVLGEWYRYCHVTTSLPGCDEGDLGEALCDWGGDDRYADLPATCHEAARLYWACLADLPWTCGRDDQDEATYDPPVADLTPCDDELATYQACGGG